MKLKNVTFVEHHIEKIVLGVGVLFLVVVGWFYFLGRPYAVDLPAQKGASPEKVEEIVRSRAVALKEKIGRTESPLPKMSVPDYTQDFQRRVARPVTGVERFATPFEEPGLDRKQFEVQELAPQMVKVPAVPVPGELKLRGGYAVLAEQPDPKQTEALVKVIGDQVPRDFRYVSVMGSFSMKDWRGRLRSGVQDERIPEDWWRSLLAISDVVLERQKQDPVTGEWGPVEEVIPMPGNLSFRNVPKNLANTEAELLLQQVKYEQARLTQVPFPLLDREQNWVPPDVAVRQLSLEEHQRLRKLKEDIADLDGKIKQMQDRLHQLQGGTQEPAGPRVPIVRPGAEESVRPERPGRPERPQPQRQVRSRTEVMIEQTQSQLNRMTDQRIKAQREMNQILGIPDEPVAPAPGAEGFDPNFPPPDMLPDGTPIPPAPGRRVTVNPAQPPAMGPDGMPLPEGQPQPTGPVDYSRVDQVKVWTHDLTVEPGATYRYRMRVAVLNPLYHRAQLTPDQKKEYFERLSLISEPSQWSEPVTVEAQHRFFLVAANQQQQTATVEVWRVVGGSWQRWDFVVRPGDPIGGVVKINSGGSESEVDLRLHSVCVDIDFNAPARQGMATTTTVMLYQPIRGGAMGQRSLDDRDNPERIRLQNESTMKPVAEAR